MRFSVPDVNPEDSAHIGECIVVASGCSFFGNGKPFATTINSPTWAALLAVAKDAQKVTGDYHHDFFEGCCVIDVINDVPVLQLMLGS